MKENENSNTPYPVQVKKEKIDPELDKITTPPPTPEPETPKKNLDGDNSKDGINGMGILSPEVQIKKELETCDNNDAQPEVRGDLEVQKVWMDPRSDEIKSKLTEIGALVVDDNVLFTLHNLKDLGKIMWQSGVIYDSKVANSGQQTRQQRCGRSLFTDFGSGDSTCIQPVDILTPLSGNAGIKQESHDSQVFNSPPAAGRVFGGMKRLSSDAFVELKSSAKRNKSKGSTPSICSMSGSSGLF